MTNVYIIMGDCNSRKTSTMRALTGVRNECVFEVETIHQGTLDVYVKLSSLQESNIEPLRFIEHVNRSSYDNVLVALWVTGRKRNKLKFPDGIDYINQFKNAGWNIAGVAILETTATVSPIQNAVRIANSSSIPCNKTASCIRGNGAGISFILKKLHINI